MPNQAIQAPIGTKEIEVYKKEITKAEKFSLSLEVKTQEDYETALAEGKDIKTKLDTITRRKEEITKPLNAALKSARDLFKPLESAGETALATIKRKMLDYTNEQERKANEAKLKLAERVERGTMKAETAVRKIEAIQEPQTTVKTDQGKATTKTVKKYRVTDKSLIPYVFMEPNMTAIKQSFKDGQPVPGVEEYEEKELSLYN